jgi:methanesulfonate monooxygenase subunit beta
MDEPASEQARSALRRAGIGRCGIANDLAAWTDPAAGSNFFGKPAPRRRPRGAVNRRTAKWGSPVDAAALVRDTIYRSTILLDRQDWNEWLAHCDDEFQYAIRAWSPEINRDVTYLALDRQALASMIKLLPKHNTDHSPLTRHTSVYTVDVDDQAHSAKAVSSVIVYQNLLDGINSHIDAGESRLFLVGKYIDTFKIENNKAKFVSREVRIENRRLDKGSHWPI